MHRLSLTDCDYIKDLRPAEWGPAVILRGNNPQDRMSALGQKRTFTHLRLMSVLPPIADIDRARWDVRFVPKADIRTANTLREASYSQTLTAGYVQTPRYPSHTGSPRVQ